MGVGAWAVGADARSRCRPSGRAIGRLALAGGLLFGVCFFLSYGLVLLGVIPLGVALAPPAARPLAIVAAAPAAPSSRSSSWPRGFWWLDGFAATREQYLGERRPHPAVRVLPRREPRGVRARGRARDRDRASARLRDRRAAGCWSAAALVAVALADLSGMSKAEVERIWLPFLPWVLLAAAALPPRSALQRRCSPPRRRCAIASRAVVVTTW